MSFPLRMLVVALAVIAGANACRTPEHRADATTRAFVDDFGDTLRLSAPPQRIVSLNPASTELLFVIGAGHRVVGRTTWDSWPAAALAVPDLGAGLRPNVEAVLGARPDLVLLYAAEDNRAAARQLRAAGVPTLTLRIDRMAEFARAATWLGQVLGDTLAANATRDSVLATVSRIAADARTRRGDRPPPSVAWPIGDQPLYVIGGPSFLGELIDSAGGRNAFGDLAQPSPQIAFEELLRRDPDVIVAGAASAARMAKTPRWQALRAVREGRVIIADSVRTGRPGPRLGEAAAWLAAALRDVAAASAPVPR